MGMTFKSHMVSIRPLCQEKAESTIVKMLKSSHCGVRFNKKKEEISDKKSRRLIKIPICTSVYMLDRSEAEFFDVIGTKFVRVFLLAILRHLFKKIILPAPLEQKWFESGFEL